MDRTVPLEPLPGGTVADQAFPALPRPCAPPVTVGASAGEEKVQSFVAGPWTLPWSPTACAQARSAIRDVLSRWGLGGLVPTTELLVSELVSNALRHAVGPLVLTLERVSDVRCLVSDGSSAPPRPTDAGLEAEHGRGLALVGMLAARWGWEHRPAGKSVWFELSADTHPPGRDGGEDDRKDGVT